MVSNMNDFELEKTELNPTIKFIVMIAASVIVALFTVMGGCSMHSNTFDGERLRGQAEIERTKTERSVAESNAEKEEILAIERLVYQGVNPIAARCAVKGNELANFGENICVLATK